MLQNNLGSGGGDEGLVKLGDGSVRSVILFSLLVYRMEVFHSNSFKPYP